MSIKINTRFGARLTSEELNNKIKAVVGGNVVTHGFEVTDLKDGTVRVNDGTAIVEGAVIEIKDEFTVIQVPEIAETPKFVVIDYKHREGEVEITVTDIVTVNQCILAKLQKPIPGEGENPEDLPKFIIEEVKKVPTVSEINSVLEESVDLLKKEDTKIRGEVAEKANSKDTYNKKEIDLRFEDIIGGGAVSNSSKGFIINKDMWEKNPTVSSKYYSIHLNHELNTERILVAQMDANTKDNVEPIYRTDGVDHVWILCIEPMDLVVSVINGNSNNDAVYARIDDTVIRDNRTLSSKKIMEELQNVINTASNVAFNKRVLPSDWVYKDGWFTVEFQHSLGTTNLLPGAVDNTTGENLAVACKSDGANRATISCKSNADITVFVVNANSQIVEKTREIDDERIGKDTAYSSEKIESIVGITENTKHRTSDGKADFECSNGYIDNVYMEGETVINLFKIDNETIYKPENNDKMYLFNEDLKYLYSSGDMAMSIFYIPNNINIWFEIKKKTENIATKTVRYDPASKIFNITDEEFVGSIYVEKSRCSDSDFIKIAKSTVIVKGTKPAISHFEGIRSIGQGNNIEITTHSSNNLFTSIGITEGKYLGANGEEIINSAYGFTDFIQINDTVYTSNFRHGVCMYDLNKRFISYVVMDGCIPKVRNARYMRVNATLSEMNNYIITSEDIDKKRILTTLRGIDENNCDKLYGNKKIEKYFEMKIDGNLNFTWGTFMSNTGSVILNIPKAKLLNNASNEKYPMLCDRFLVGSPTDRNADKEVVTIASWDANAQLFVRINNSKTTIVESDATNIKLSKMKTYLNNNPFTLVIPYESFETIELPSYNPRTFTNKTTLLINTGVINKEAEFEVTSSLGSALEVMKKKISDLDSDASYKIHVEYWFNGFYGNKWSGFSNISDGIKGNISKDGQITLSGFMGNDSNSPAQTPVCKLNATFKSKFRIEGAVINSDSIKVEDIVLLVDTDGTVKTVTPINCDQDKAISFNLSVFL